MEGRECRVGPWPVRWMSVRVVVVVVGDEDEWGRRWRV